MTEGKHVILFCPLLKAPCIQKVLIIPDDSDSGVISRTINEGEKECTFFNFEEDECGIRLKLGI